MRARRFARFALGLAATLVVAGVVRADAPVGQYATFGQSDVCISDVKTQLTWLRTPLATTYKFSDAAAQCANKGPGWRVPSVNELETLVDENPHLEIQNGAPVSVAIDANAFPRTPATDPYWTSSVVPGQTTAWAVNFQDGSTLTPPQSQDEQVRCVIVTPPTTPAACVPPPQ
jgi:hypothetical protein